MSAVLETWEAERVDRVLEGGRTMPIVAECIQVESIDNLKFNAETERFVVKGIGNPHVEEFSLFNEVVGNLLAARLGLITPEPALIKITPEFARAASSTLGRHGFSLEPGIASGSVYLGSGLIPPTPEMISGDRVDQIARIYAFDLLVQNPDRRADKPNCLYQKENIIAFDFELCFSFVLAIGASDPCDFSKHGIARKHFFRAALSRCAVDWRPFLKSLAALTDAEIEAMIKAVPVEWQQFAPKIEEHLKFMTRQSDRIELELQRSLL